MNSLRHALRSLYKSPGFSLVAVLMLALGIGLSAGSFSMANTFLLRNVPYPEPDRLLRLFVTTPQFDRGSFSPGNILALRESATSFSGVCLYNNDQYSLGEPGQPAEQVQGMDATANFFELLGVRPVLGRTFAAGDDEPGHSSIVVLTHRAWVRRYASDPAVLGRTVRLNSENFTVVGVLPASFDAPLVWGSLEYVRPMAIQPGFATNFKDSWIQGLARLKPGVSREKAQTELSLLATRLTKEHPKENASIGLRAVSLHDANMDDVSRMLLWLMTALSLAMLLIACANLASLQVARAFNRSREFAIRSALGGDRRQLMLPLLLESILLAVVGGVLGIVVASWNNAIIGHFLRINNEPGFDIPLDGRVLAFAAFSAILSGLAFGLAPAWLASRCSAADALKDGARGSTAGRSHNRLKNTLIVAELGIALALVGVATSFGVGSKSFLHRQVGWNADNLFAGYISLPWNRYHEDEKNRPFQRALLQKLEAIPGVEHAVICGDVPRFYLGGGTRGFNVDGLPVAERGHEPLTQTVSVTADYFATLGLNLKSGRTFSPSLTENDPDQIVINESFAKRYWPDGSALGRRIKFGDEEKWSEIIGVVGDIKLLARLETPETPLQAWRASVQHPDRYLALVLRGKVAPDSFTQSVRQAVASLDADLPLTEAGDVRTGVDHALSNLNLVIINLGVSAGMGLLIAGIGLFGVISQLTAQRTRDFGVRIALGATMNDILGHVIGGGMKLLVIGLALGIPAFFGLNRLLAAAMPSIEFPGLWLLALDMLFLSLTMLLACYLPARRAARISPVEALRAE